MLNRAVAVDRLGGSGLMTLALRTGVDGLWPHKRDLHLIGGRVPRSLGHWVGGLERRHVPPALHRNVVGMEGGWTRNLIIGVSGARPLYKGWVVGVDRCVV